MCFAASPTKAIQYLLITENKQIKKMLILVFKIILYKEQLVYSKFVNTVMLLIILPFEAV